MIEVNLLPESQGSRGSGKRGKSRSRKKASGSLEPRTSRGTWGTALFAALAIIPAAVLFLWWTQRTEAASLDERLVEATANQERLAALRQVSDSLTARRQEIRERVALIEQLDRNRFVWPHLMDEISRALPRLAWLSTLRQTTPLPNVGVQIQGVAANPLAITEFVRNLEASDYITEVKILGSQREELEGGELVVQAFTLTVRFAHPADDVRRTEPIIANTGM